MVGVDGSLRAPRERLAENQLAQPGLWRLSVSGDLPIVLVHAAGLEAVPLVRQVLQAQEYWRLKGLTADVVILNEEPVSYLDELQTALTALLDAGPWRDWRQRPAGAYLIPVGSVSNDERALLSATSRAVLNGGRGDLRAHLDRPYDGWTPAFPADVVSTPTRTQVSVAPVDEPVPVPPMTFANGLGGVADDGRTYVVVLEGEQETPAPWANVIANPGFGTVVTAWGSSYTWSENSRENRLTSFANDPVADPTAEAWFIRDDESGEVWCPTPGPVRRHADSGRMRRPTLGGRHAVHPCLPRDHSRARGVR